MKRRTDHEPPAHWQDFEDLCLKLWRPRLIDAKKNGRTGQPQAGVDIFGRDPKTDEWVGIQCKQRGRWPKKDLTTGEIKAEVEQAESFEPALLHFIVATTAPRDAEVQKFIREFSDGRRAEGKFTVDLFAWDDLQDWLQEKQPESIQPRERQPVIPPATRDFSGRADELEKLHRMVGEHGGAMIYGVRGLGGIGKTQLGLKLVETVGDDYPDGHILVELGGASDHPLSTRDAMASVIRAYEPQSRLPEAEEDVRRLYHQTLRNRRAIVLLDDAASPQQVESLLPHTGCLALVTSRWRFALPKLHRLDLDALTPEAARELLFSLAPQLGAQADRLAELLGRLPLALRLAGSAFAEDPFLKPYEYMQMFERREKRLGLMEKVEQAIGFNYQALEPELRQQWRTLAVFPGDFDVAGAAAVWAMEADAARNVLATVYRAGLAEWRSGRCRLHDLARDFAASQLEVVERHKAAAQHAAHYVGVLEEANRLYLKGGGKILEGFALFDAEWRNISVGQAWAATEADNDHETAKLCKMYSSCSAYILSLRLHPRKWIAWLKAGRSAAVSLGDRHGEGSTLTNLGLAYKDLGELEKAIECHKKALLIDREINDRLGESADLGSLGLAYVDLGELKKAIGYHKQHLTIAREIGDRRGEGNAQGNLGVPSVVWGTVRGHSATTSNSWPLLVKLATDVARATPLPDWAVPTARRSRKRRSATTSKRWPFIERSATGETKVTC